MKSRTLLVTAALLLPTTACGTTSDSSTPSAAPSTPDTTGSANDAKTIPSGVYEKTVTEKDVQDVGVDPGGIAFSPDGTALVVYKFADGVWTQFSGPTEDQLDPGSDGTHHYDDGNLVLSEECCGDSILTWSWDGTKLTMALETGDQPFLPIDHLMRDGTYTKTG